MLEDLKPVIKITSCAVRTVFSSLDDKDKIILEGFIADYNTWPSESLSNALRTKNILLSGKLITRHRRGECSCSKILK